MWITRQFKRFGSFKEIKDVNSNLQLNGDKERKWKEREKVEEKAL